LQTRKGGDPWDAARTEHTAEFYHVHVCQHCRCLRGSHLDTQALSFRRS